MHYFFLSLYSLFFTGITETQFTLVQVRKGVYRLLKLKILDVYMALDAAGSRGLNYLSPQFPHHHPSHTHTHTHTHTMGIACASLRTN